jgi:hypothetical protein
MSGLGLGLRVRDMPIFVHNSLPRRGCIVFHTVLVKSLGKCVWEEDQYRQASAKE